MIEFAVTAVVEIVAVPLTSVTVPKELAPAVVVEATEVERTLLPAVPKTKLPLVAVIAPDVAVSVVVAVIEPGAVNDEGIDKVRVEAAPVEVIWLFVPKMLKLPVVGLSDPPESPVSVEIKAVPGVTAIVSVEPAPATATAPLPTIESAPDVGLIGPPLLPAIVDIRFVPGVIEPVNTDPAPPNDKAPDPNINMLPAEGLTAPPVLPVSVLKVVAPPPVDTHVAATDPPNDENDVNVYSALSTESIHLVPNL
jgi:hypothetical protein